MRGKKEEKITKEIRGTKIAFKGKSNWIPYLAALHMHFLKHVFSRSVMHNEIVGLCLVL